MKMLKQVKKCIAIGWLFLVSNIAFATNYIPTSSDEQAQSSESFTETIMRVFANDIVPLIELVGSGILIYFGVKTIIGTVQEYKEKREFGVLLEGIVVLAILFGVGAALFYLFSFIKV